MVIEINDKIRRLLVEYNPQWKNLVEPRFRHRSALEKIRKRISEPQIISLCGLRRVGKTTLLEKIIFDCCKTHGADSTMYFSMDDFTQIELLDVIDAFKEIHGKEPKFVFLDEVQKLDNWAEKVKILYDTKKYKLFISGSQSLFLRKGSRESLAGRIFEFEISTLTFLEYLEFSGKKHLAQKPLLYGKELEAEFNNYLLTGGFPEMIGKKDAKLIREYVKNSIVEKIVFSDMPRLYQIEEPAKVAAILDVLVDNPGMIVELTSLSQKLGLSRQTLSKYLDYLEQAHLVVKTYNYSRNRLTSEKKLKKAYPTFLTTALYDLADPSIIGKIVEAKIVLATGAKFFWRDAYKNEVDAVLHEKQLQPIEVKYRNDPRETASLKKFCGKHACANPIVVTKNTREKIGGIKLIPAYEYLLNNSN
ncbi:ATP-binding protein [Candidatus Micrarchaeota archaeon]|nr:ATP-binding protein [Candidatus Micrarchaeota archaeon]